MTTVRGVLTKHDSLGLIHKHRPIFSTQFHPEAKGGPQDSSYLFDTYLQSVRAYKQSQAIFQPQRDSRPSPLLIDLLAKERVGVAPPLAASVDTTHVDSAAAAAAASAA